MQRDKRIIKVDQIENLTERRRACDHCAGRAANSPWKIMMSARGGEGSVQQHEVLL